MAKEEESEEQEEVLSEADTLSASIKTNRNLVFGLFGFIVVVASILLTSVLMINGQMSSRREVPSEEFAEQLDELNSHLSHLIAIHNSEAKLYFTFEEELAAVKAIYQNEKINGLRRLLVQREADHRKLLELNSEGVSSLASMVPGSRAWTKNYKAKVQETSTLSLRREAEIKATIVTQ